MAAVPFSPCNCSSKPLVQPTKAWSFHADTEIKMWWVSLPHGSRSPRHRKVNNEGKSKTTHDYAHSCLLRFPPLFCLHLFYDMCLPLLLTSRLLWASLIHPHTTYARLLFKDYLFLSTRFYRGVLSLIPRWWSFGFLDAAFGPSFTPVLKEFQSVFRFPWGV